MLRRVLLTTTTLIGAALIASAASAQTAGPKAPFTAILDGEVNGNIGILSGTQNSGNNGGHQRDFGMEQNAWMRFFFQTKADNGLTYGWNVRIMGTSSTITANGFSNDREGIFFRHDAWGTLSIGNDTATGKQGFPTVKADWGPPSSSQSYLGPDGKLEGEFLRTTDTRAFNIYNTLIKVGSDNSFPSGRAMHIWYGTPSYAGFSLSGDYAPDGRARNEEQFVTSTFVASPGASGTLAQSLSATNFQNIVSVNLQYKGSIGPVALGTGIQYAHAQSKNNYSLVGGTEAASQSFRDANSFETGFVTNYAGFQFAVQYSWFGDTGQPKAVGAGNNIIGGAVSTWGWSTGLEYFMGPWVIGGYYWYGRGPGTFQWGTGSAVAVGGPGEFEFNYYAIGAGYTVAPGLKFYGEMFYYDDWNTHVVSSAPNSGRHLTGQVYILGTSIAW